ncbi:MULTISPECIES: PTS fructose transporter subunit IIB [Vibrio]|uniref:protein-N(pi)-phosphohistidine--D-fructose phosphotransferase n=1 Tax=Vibrio algicola TaxID=2662262 RepID=A0A5Q0TGW6_9VIBR|nr:MULTISPECIES: PTS fructose transporter subunit IIB [Vibrio]MBD1577147.1 PTS fructose transporter subunit IIB [Vibrio sp. S11_S32]
MKIVAVTACPTGIAHTYMAAEALVKSAAHLKINIQVETQGAMGIENKLSYHDISHADIALIASDIEIEQAERFEQCHVIKSNIEEVLTNPDAVIKRCLDGF